MDGIGTASPGGFENEIAAQVGFGGRCRAQAIGLLRMSDVQAGTVGVGIDGDGWDAQLLACTDDAQSDLAPVGDQDFLIFVFKRVVYWFPCGAVKRFRRGRFNIELRSLSDARSSKIDLARIRFVVDGN